MPLTCGGPWIGGACAHRSGACWSCRCDLYRLSFPEIRHRFRASDLLGLVGTAVSVCPRSQGLARSSFGDARERPHREAMCVTRKDSCSVPSRLLGCPDNDFACEPSPHFQPDPPWALNCIFQECQKQAHTSRRAKVENFDWNQVYLENDFTSAITCAACWAGLTF